MQREEAIRLMTGGVLRNGQTAQAENRWQHIVKNVENRTTYNPASPLLETPPSLRHFFETFKERQDVRSALHPLEWTVAFVDLTQNILTYQRIIISEDAKARLRSVDKQDLDSIAALCLPAPHSTQVQVAFDPTQAALTASSLNPNLRVGGLGTFDTVTPGGQQQKIFGFNLGFGASFVQLAEYQGRWMVRDGYHRIYGLLQLGITQIPTVIVKAKRLEETGAGRAGFFDYETLLSDHPPLMADFLSDEFAVDIQLQAQMKVVRIKAEEYFVPIYMPGEDTEPSA